MSEKTIPELLRNRVKEHGTKLLFQRRDGWSWKQITWLDFDRKVKNIAAFLHDLGFGRGDRALIVSSNRLEAISAEIAIFHLGGVIVPLASDQSPERIKEVAEEVHVKLILLELRASIDGVLGSLDKIPGLVKVIVFPDAKIKNESVIDFKAVLKFGLMKRKKLEDELAGIYNSIDPESPSALFSNSGSEHATVVTQGRLLEALHNASIRCRDVGVEDQSFSFLTAASPFAKFINYLTLFQGVRAALAETRRDFYQDLVEVMPTVLFETRAGLDSLCANFLSNLNGLQPGKKLRMDMGNRVKHILTDSIPGGEIGSLLGNTGAIIVEVPEFDSLLV
ncbi:MAG: AMP-binding protein [Thermodesulfobacteriota bacterium]